MAQRKMSIFLFGVTTCVFATACTSGGASAAKPSNMATGSSRESGLQTSGAHADITALSNSGVTGTVHFAPIQGGIEVTGTIRGLGANSMRGFHLHDKGDCSSPDGMSAGGHFNPTHMQHGAPETMKSHFGDLGNIISDASGVATIHVKKLGPTIGDGEGNIIGRSVIVHALKDDLITQPTGGAGGRVACGVVVAD
jgi:Cu-Zn family superoxide dismutase